jgi:MFS family permease
VLGGPPVTGAAAPPLGAARARLLLAATCIPLLAQSLDVSGMGLLLPSIGADLGADATTLGWVMNANPVAFGALLVPIGRWADRVGPRSLLLGGVAGFGVASLLCAVAPDAGWLVAGRALQGASSAACFTTSLAVVSSSFDDVHRPAAVGIWSAVSGVGSALGPMLSGALAAGPGWRAFFLVNGPLCLLAVPMLAAVVPRAGRVETDRAERRPLGAAAVAAGFVAVSVVAGRLGNPDWWGPVTLAAAVVAGVAVALLARHRHDVVAPEALAGPWCRVALAVAFTSTWGFGVTLVVIGQYLQRIRGLDPATAGAVFLGFSVAFAAAALASGSVVRRAGVRRTLVLAMAVASLGLAGTLAFAPDTPIAGIVVVLVVGGVGQGLAFSASTTASLAGVDPAVAGETTGVTQTLRLLGTTLGVAVSAALASLAGRRPDVDRALLGAERVALGIALAVGLGGFVAALRARPRRRSAPPR